MLATKNDFTLYANVMYSVCAKVGNYGAIAAGQV